MFATLLRWIARSVAADFSDALDEATASLPPIARQVRGF